MDAFSKITTNMAMSRDALFGLLNAATDAIVFRDCESRMVFCNAAYQDLSMLVLGRAPVVGDDAFLQLMPEQQMSWQVIVDKVLAGERYSNQRALDISTSAAKTQFRFYEFTLAPVLEKGKAVGYAEFNHDVTAQKNTASSQQVLISKLNRIVSETELIKGVIPICSYCKNARDDQGKWHRIEHYIAQRSKAEFSHGVCPDCLEHEMRKLD